MHRDVVTHVVSAAGFFITGSADGRTMVLIHACQVLVIYVCLTIVLHFVECLHCIYVIYYIYYIYVIYVCLTIVLH